MTSHSDSLPEDPNHDQGVEKWLRELEAAGWKKASGRTWQAPCGCQFLGPYRAWHCMTMGHVELHAQTDRILASEAKVQHG